MSYIKWYTFVLSWLELASPLITRLLFQDKLCMNPEWLQVKRLWQYKSRKALRPLHSIDQLPWMQLWLQVRSSAYWLDYLGSRNSDTYNCLDYDALANMLREIDQMDDVFVTVWQGVLSKSRCWNRQPHWKPILANGTWFCAYVCRECLQIFTFDDSQWYRHIRS